MSNKSVKTAPKFVYNCVSCGQYCSKIEKVPVSFQDISRWRKNGLLNGLVQNIGMDMTGGFPQLVLENKEGEKGCPMYDSANKICQIHHDMPLNCQAYPLSYNGSKYFVSDKACQGLGQGSMDAEQLKTQRDAAMNDYEARIESNTLVPMLYSIIMGDLVDQSRKSMEHMTDEQKAQIQDIVKEEKN
ncbi:MAG: hypothetical protein CXT75_02100 [Methanobacteriota archaeon]|nr:MAG: hypothetical protein CXT75_02100 [Euryarchaeota archaeon]